MLFYWAIKNVCNTKVIILAQWLGEASPREMSKQNINYNFLWLKHFCFGGWDETLISVRFNSQYCTNFGSLQIMWGLLTQIISQSFSNKSDTLTLTSLSLLTFFAFYFCVTIQFADRKKWKFINFHQRPSFWVNLLWWLLCCLSDDEEKHTKHQQSMTKIFPPQRGQFWRVKWSKEIIIELNFSHIRAVSRVCCLRVVALNEIYVFEDHFPLNWTRASDRFVLFVSTNLRALQKFHFPSEIFNFPRCGQTERQFPNEFRIITLRLQLFVATNPRGCKKRLFRFNEKLNHKNFLFLSPQWKMMF